LAGLFAARGGAQLWRLWRWRGRGIWQVPLLWSLHLADFWFAVAPLGMALWSLGLALAPSQALHALAVGGMGGLSLATLARGAAGYTGCAVPPPATTSWASAVLNSGCAARGFLPRLLPANRAVPLARLLYPSGAAAELQGVVSGCAAPFT
ncbi:NnrS family protein, partial [Pseudomonas aeruginosa]